MVVGTSASTMDLELFSVTDKFLQKMDDNDALLGSYAVDDDSRIHVCTRILPSSKTLFIQCSRQTTFIL